MAHRIELFGGPLDGVIIDGPPPAFSRIEIGMRRETHKVSGPCWKLEHRRAAIDAIAYYALHGNRWEHVGTETQ